MKSDRYEARCKRCNHTFEHGLFSRNYPYCAACAAELDGEALRRIGAAEVSYTEGWPEAPSSPAPESEAERQQRYTREDHRRAMDDYGRRNRP